MTAIVRSKPVHVRDTLAALGIPVDHLYEALLAGEKARDACPPHDPHGAAGYASWHIGTRVLREKFCGRPLNWEKRDDNNLPLIVNPSQTIAIMLASGDDPTGLEGAGTPSRKYSIGTTAIEAVEENQKQLGLFESKFPKRTKSCDAHMRTYVLLRRRAGEKLYAELSLPSVLRTLTRNDGQCDTYVQDWAERNILEPLIMTPPPLQTQNTEPEEIDVPVRRRQ